MVKKNLKRAICSIMVMVFCIGMITFVPTTSVNADRISQFNYYVECAAQNGLIPSRLKDNLNENLTWEDWVDFIIVFSSVKCGIDVEAMLTRTKLASSSEEAAKIAVINELAKRDLLTIVDIDTDNGQGSESNIKVGIEDALISFMYVAHKLIAPFSPLLYDLEHSFPVTRYNFQNFPDVVYSPNVLGSLISEIIGLSQGVQSLQITDFNAPITRRQFAAFLYMFSTMSLPIDRSGKYSGGSSGSKSTDDFITAILDKVVTQNMNDEEKIKAIYDYMIYNFSHDDNSFPFILGGGGDGSANPLQGTNDLAFPIIYSGKGTCDVFANVFRLLALRLGFECNYVSGQYINKNGTRSGHGWNQVKINDEWYWFDVDVENTVFHNGSNSAPLYFLYMKNDIEWTTNHQWDKSNWPAADGTKHPVQLLTIEDESAQTKNKIALSSPQKITIDGKLVDFETYNIDGFNYFKLRDLAFALNGTEAQFEVGWNETQNSITLTTGKTYVSVGGEMFVGDKVNKNATPTTAKVIVNGTEVSLVAYNIDGYNYFKLRDIGEAIGFDVDWDATDNAVVIDTTR